MVSASMAAARERKSRSDRTWGRARKDLEERSKVDERSKEEEKNRETRRDRSEERRERRRKERWVWSDEGNYSFEVVGRERKIFV